MDKNTEVKNNKNANSVYILSKAKSKNQKRDEMRYTATINVDFLWTDLKKKERNYRFIGWLRLNEC